MSWIIFLYIIAGLLFSIIVAGVIYFIVNKTRNIGDPENEPIIHNFLLMYAPFREGNVKDIKVGENRVKIKFFPRDIDYIKANNDEEYKKLLKEYTIYYDKRQLEIESGDASPNRIIIKAYPNDPSLLTEGLKNTTEGKAIMNKISENNQLSDESELMQQRMNKLKEVASKDFGGEIFTNYVEMSQEILKDKSELIKKEEKKFGENK